MSGFDNPWHASARTLRQFACLWFVFVGLLSWRCGLFAGQLAGILLGVSSVTVGVAGLIWPAAVRPLFAGLTLATWPIGWVVSKLLLIVIFYGLFTPLGLLFRLVGRDALQRRFEPQRPSYWDVKTQPLDPAHYFQPF